MRRWAEWAKEHTTTQSREEQAAPPRQHHPEVGGGKAPPPALPNGKRGEKTVIKKMLANRRPTSGARLHAKNARCAGLACGFLGLWRRMVVWGYNTDVKECRRTGRSVRLREKCLGGVGSQSSRGCVTSVTWTRGETKWWRTLWHQSVRGESFRKTNQIREENIFFKKTNISKITVRIHCLFSSSSDFFFEKCVPYFGVFLVLLFVKVGSKVKTHG